MGVNTSSVSSSLSESRTECLAPPMPQGLGPNAAKSSQPDFVESDPLFNFVEKIWIEPCTATLPNYMHGLCLFGPAFAFVAVLVGIVALMAYCEKKQKAAAAAEAAKKTKKTK